MSVSVYSVLLGSTWFYLVSGARLASGALGSYPSGWTENLGVEVSAIALLRARPAAVARRCRRRSVCFVEETIVQSSPWGTDQIAGERGAANMGERPRIVNASETTQSRGRIVSGTL